MIVGGRESHTTSSALRSVVIYDITRNQFQGLEPLPYPVHEMATVKWSDDDFMIMGGVDGSYQPLNKVLMYNIKTPEESRIDTFLQSVKIGLNKNTHDKTHRDYFTSFKKTL